MLCGVFTGSRRTADCAYTRITHHEVPAHNVMTQPTFAPLYRRAHSLLTRPLTARLLSVRKCVEDATASRNYLGAAGPAGTGCHRRVCNCGDCVETLLAVVTTATVFTVACHDQMQMARAYAPPNPNAPTPCSPYPVPTRPRPTEMLPSATTWPSGLDARSLGDMVAYLNQPGPLPPLR